MKVTLASCVICVAILCLVPRAGAAEKSKPDSPAAKLFEQALSADSQGDPDRRDELLRQALEVDPDYQLARWHLGEVYFQGLWRSVEGVGQLVSADPRWQDYRERLSGSDGSLTANADLARWCRDNELENEAKWHWFQVLQADTENREALGNLKVKLYRGGYYSKDEIEELERRRIQAKKDFRRFRDEFQRLVSLAERADNRQRDEALAKLAAVNDPAAIEALMSTLVDASDDKESQEFSAKVCQAIVAALGEMREHASTLKLVEIALYAPQGNVRHTAAEALRYREPTDYMPILMASLAAPLESSFSIQLAGNGLVTLSEDIYESGPLSDSRHVHTSGFSTHTSFNVNAPTVQSKRVDGGRLVTVGRSPGLTIPNIDRDLNSAFSRASATQQRVNAENISRQQRNKRIEEVLEIVTEKELGSDPKAWWVEWQESNELSFPDETSPDETYDDYDYAGPDIYPIALAAPETHFEPDPPPPPPGGYSCFVAGTPVWTQSGPKPIEQIAVGELVLSQDPTSGRLDFRPVIETTVRPPSAVMELAIGEEKIITTRGHRFWVTGEGWRMAKFLNAGASLFAAGGSTELSGVSELEDDVAYNLVVGEYHTYFVGDSRLLVHDNNCPLPTTAAVPGDLR